MYRLQNIETFQGMHVSLAKLRDVRLPRKCAHDYRTDRQTHKQTDKMIPMSKMLQGRHKNILIVMLRTQSTVVV